MLGYVWLGNQNDISTDSVKSIMKENFLTIMPVMALPATWPTALPIATPPAVAAICFIKLGCWGWPMADGGAAMGAEGGGGGGALGAGAGGARATGARGGGEAARPRRGILTFVCSLSVRFGSYRHW